MAAEFDVTWQMWATMGFIVAAIVVYCIDRIPMETTSIGLISVLMVFFNFFPVIDANGENVLSPLRLLAGFGNPALIAISALLVVGQGLYQTGAFEKPTRWLLELDVWHFLLKLIAIFAIVMVVSAFLNNTPVVVMFIPILAALAARSDLPTSSVMMPLSFLCILGGMTTLIGSSTNLLVADAYSKLGGDSIGFFDFTLPGMVLALSGVVYVAFIAPLLLPARTPKDDDKVEITGKQFIAQIELTPGHPLVGKKAIAGLFVDLPDMTVRMIQRNQDVILPPYDDVSLRIGDAVIVAATRKSLTEFLSSHPDYLHGMVGPDFTTANGKSKRESFNLVEAVIAPGSRMEGRTLAQIAFAYQTNCVILGVQRRSRMIRSRMSDIRLESGDVLLITGRSSDIMALRSHRDILLLEWSTTELPTLSHVNRARLIFAGVVVAAASGIVPIVIAAVTGAALMVWIGCLNIRQATRAISRRIFLVIGTSLALGLALQETGGAHFLAMSLVDSLHEASTPIILSAFFLLVAILTNVLSNNATAVLMTPIAVSAATQLQVDPLIFVYTVIFAANCSFATPMSYQTNLLVMGPGQYTFIDFLRVGGPLLIVIWLTYTLFIPWYFDISW